MNTAETLAALAALTAAAMAAPTPDALLASAKAATTAGKIRLGVPAEAVISDLRFAASRLHSHAGSRIPGMRYAPRELRAARAVLAAVGQDFRAA